MRAAPLPTSSTLAALCLALALPAPAAALQITIEGPKRHRHEAPLTGCGAGARGRVVLDPDPVVQVGPQAAGGPLDEVFHADLGEYPGWRLTFGGSLEGTLRIDGYLAADFGTCAGGAVMDAKYLPAIGDPLGLTFMQFFESDSPDPRFTGTHIDNFGNPTQEPLYYPAEVRAHYKRRFIDTPHDECFPDQTITTRFVTYLVDFDADRKRVTAHDGWAWGYTVSCERRVTVSPEPGVLALLAPGLGLLALTGGRTARRRRRPPAAAPPRAPG